jgi:hypothetical protein
MPDIVKLAHMSEKETLAILLDGNGYVRGVDRFDKRLEHFGAAYQTNVRRNLRFQRSKWSMRDDRLGNLSRPSNLADWPKCSVDDARFELARHVWCACVRVSNGGEL